MSNILDVIQINSTDETELERIISARTLLIDQALSTQNYELLQSISAIDKQNLGFLESAKKKLSTELANFSKLEVYLE